MTYLNIDEVESALSVATSAPYTSFTQLITVPNLTWEGRQCHAIKIAKGSNTGRPGVYFLGGVHSREWGSPDILINFVEQLEQAYLANVGLTIGGMSFSPYEIQTIVNSLDIIIFPQANPDGRNFSMTSNIVWRKNRRTVSPNSSSGGDPPGSCVGVDLNRNYDFLWDYPTYFDPSSAISDSTDPCQCELYHGPEAFSEPESKNAKWIFDTYPNIGFFIDLHSYGEDILYSWGDDDDQSSDPDMNFQNPAYNGLRGIDGDSAYKEYIPPSDLNLAVNLANALRHGILGVRGRTYDVMPSFNLYPTAGASDDYAYSRHFVDDAKGKVISYTLEWGRRKYLDPLPSPYTPFHPPYGEMQNIIQEVTAGLLSFCLWVRNSLKHCEFVIERSTLGQDEIDARRTQPPNTPGGLPVPDAFRVVVDGFTAAELGISGPSGTLNVPSPIGGMTINCTGNTSDNGDYGTEIQRFTFHYDIDFPDDSAFNFPGPTEFVTLNVTAGGVPASAQIELIKQPDPFILHGDPAWLSIDLRLLVVRASETRFGVTMGADASTAPAFIQQVMAALTSGNGTAGGETFDSLPTDESAKLFIQPTDNNGTNVFNFALAKVHYIGLIGATNVRVFFRLFQAQTTSGAFDYPPGAQYRRAPSNPHGQPISLAGIQANEYVTIPCFAEQRVDSTVVGMDQQTDDSNRQNFAAIGGPEVDRYFGCWLDTNQPFNNVLPVNVPSSNVDGPFTDPSNPPLTIQQAIIRSPHQCLIAEIAFDPVAIPTGKDPSNWDKLAQRNIAWSDIGSAQALTTFEIRPTSTGLPADQTPDELMIDWGDIPNGSVATIYLPAVNVADILAMAAKMYTSHRLVRVDDHTVRCHTGGITYIPISPSGGVNYAGLLSIDLPAKVRKDQVFNVVVRQVTNAFGKYVPPSPPPPGITAHERQRSKRDIIEWRRVLGAFQLTIPVKTKEQLLVTEERELSVLRWIAETIPPHNRWYPVFRRYLEQIAGRVSAFNGDPTIIGPSPTGDWRKPKPKPPREREEERIAFTGKIAGLIFDRFGDFEGFLLDTEDGERKFFSREKEIEDLSERAWRERLRLTVWAERHEPHRALSIIIREPPASFHG